MWARASFSAASRWMVRAQSAEAEVHDPLVIDQQVMVDHRQPVE
jgi:hypothetical protein